MCETRMSSPRFVKIKRKASESAEPPSGFKKFKFVGSSESGDTAVLKQLIVDKKPALAQFDEDLLITDYEDFVFEKSSVRLQHESQVITVNGVPFIQAPSNIGLEKEEEGSETKYVYDVYWFEEDEPGKEELLAEEEYREVRDEEYSSNDEDHPDNDYPDEEENEYKHYGDYDETHDMIREFESHRLRDSDSDEEWAGLED